MADIILLSAPLSGYALTGEGWRVNPC